jgi:hypothetical protein
MMRLDPQDSAARYPTLHPFSRPQSKASLEHEFPFRFIPHTRSLGPLQQRSLRALSQPLQQLLALCGRLPVLERGGLASEAGAVGGDGEGTALDSSFL